MKCEDPEKFNFFFSCFVDYSDLNFKVFQHQKCYVMSLRHGRQLWEEQNFVINHPAMFKTLFLGLLFAVESKSGIKMLLNLLLLDIISPKYATLFIRDQLQNFRGSLPPSPQHPPPPQKLILLSIFLNDIQLNSKLCILKHCIHLMFTFSSGWILSALCGVLFNASK